MLWAISDRKPESATDITKHDDRGVRSVHLLSTQTEQRAKSILHQAGLITLDFAANKVSIWLLKRNVIGII